MDIVNILILIACIGLLVNIAILIRTVYTTIREAYSSQDISDLIDRMSKVLEERQNNDNDYK